MTAASNEEGLTERQRNVLHLVREGKNPTDIGKELGVSSQAVHGHLRKLRDLGFISEPAGPPRGAAARKANGRREPVEPESALLAVQRAINEQLALVDARMAEIGAEITALEDERTRLEVTRQRLQDYGTTPDAAA
jgi:predicted ArsR family transcriptional regulator